MSASTGLFVLGMVSATATFCVLYRARGLGLLIIPYFFTAWLQAELAVFHVLWQSGLAAWLIYHDALASPMGIVGLCLLLGSFVGLLRSHQLSRGAKLDFEAALDEGLGADFGAVIADGRQPSLADTIDWREWMKPFSMKRSGIRVARAIPYGPAGRRNTLDVYQPEIAGTARPVLLQVHGGAWMIGNKQQQALPLIYRMAQNGWVCVSINYRLSPRATFPDHIEDVKLALAWIKHHIADFGGDPAFVAITGGSAGGHLAALAALTANQPEYQPGIEHVDTSVQAAVPIYGVYDWLDESGSGGIETLHHLLTKWVMKSTAEENPQYWYGGRPLTQVHAAAPPMMLVHGSHDSLVAVEDARHFVAALRAVATNPVVYAEVRGAQHAFEIFHSVRCDYCVNSVAQFLEWSHSRWCLEQGK